MLLRRGSALARGYGLRDRPLRGRSLYDTGIGTSRDGGGGPPGGGFLLSAPVLDWDDETADDTPDLIVDFDDAVAEGDVVVLEYDDNSGFTSPAEATDTLDAGEVAAGAINLALLSLANGTYYMRARVERGGNPISPWSNTETVTINVASAGGAWATNFWWR